MQPWMMKPRNTMRELKELGYTSEPHAAVAYRALRDQLNQSEYGLFSAPRIRQNLKERGSDSR